ncbi:MAG: hypothetical protein L3J47_08585 [Sulfurovum sp.]|nr:hypothetical protein [Sulfurovum sp.]
MKYQTFSILLKEYYHIRRAPDILIEGKTFTKEHKRVFQELFKIIVKQYLPLPSHTLSILFLKDFYHHQYIQMDVRYEVLTRTFHIEKMYLEVGKKEVSPLKDSHTIVLDDFSFDAQIRAFKTQKERVKYTKLLKQVRKRRKKCLLWSRFYACPTGNLLDRSAVLSPENIIIETSRKRREERKAVERKRLKRQKEKEYAVRYASPKISYRLKIHHNDQVYEIRKTKHIYHKRNGKARIEGFNDEMIKHLFLFALEDGEIVQYKRCVLIFPKDALKSNYYSILVDFNQKKHCFTIITLFADDTHYRKLFHFPQEKHAVYIDGISFEGLQQKS